MPIKNPRINITLEESTELVLKALERREDMALSAIAEIRDTKKTQKIKHSDAWK